MQERDRSSPCGLLAPGCRVFRLLQGEVVAPVDDLVFHRSRPYECRVQGLTQLPHARPDRVLRAADDSRWVQDGPTATLEVCRAIREQRLGQLDFAVRIRRPAV